MAIAAMPPRALRNIFSSRSRGACQVVMAARATPHSRVHVDATKHPGLLHCQGLVSAGAPHLLVALTQIISTRGRPARERRRVPSGARYRDDKPATHSRHATAR